MITGTTFLCCLCAVLFWVCNAIEIILGAKRSTKWRNTEDDYKQLIPNYIVDDWLSKADTKGLEIAEGCMKGIFWIVFSLPIVEMAWVLSKGGERNLVSNLAIMLFVLGGSWTKWFSAIFWNGMYISFHQVAAYFNLEDWLDSASASNYNINGEDGIGWRALEVNYIVSRGLVWIVNAVEWLYLAAIFIFTFISVYRWRMEDDTSFGAKWNSLGLFIGLLAVVEFIAEMVGFEGFKMAWIFFVLYAALNRLILIPTWIVILGFQLPAAKTKTFDVFDDEGYDNTTGPSIQMSPNRSSQDLIEDIDLSDNNLPLPGGERTSGPLSPPAEAFTATK